MNEKLRPLVLIYEPNVELHTTLTHAFKQFDIDVEFVTELNKLLPAVLKRKPNAVVIREPEIDTAVGICRTLRAASNSGGFVIVIQSESKDIRAKMDVLEAGGDEHVSLSTDPREVALKVFRLITKNPRVPFSQEDGPTGSIGEVTIADLLEIFNANKWTGKAIIKSDDKEGEIIFKDGEMVDAKCGVLRGEDAVLEMASWPTGYFKIVHKEKEFPESLEKTVNPEEDELFKQLIEEIPNITLGQPSKPQEIEIREPETATIKPKPESVPKPQPEVKLSIRPISERFRKQVLELLHNISRFCGNPPLLIAATADGQVAFYPEDVDIKIVSDILRAIFGMLRLSSALKENIESVLERKLEMSNELMFSYGNQTLYMKNEPEKKWMIIIVFDQKSIPFGLVKTVLPRYADNLTKIVKEIGSE